MSELFESLDQLRQPDRTVAIATLVDTRGTTPRKEGAKMLVGEGGRILGSVTIGGCVDARVIEEAEATLADGAPRLLELTLGDEDAWETGLSCGGTVEVFVEAVQFGCPGDPTVRCYERLRAHLAQGGRAAIVTRLDAPNAGSKLLVLDDGVVEGVLGDVHLERRCGAAAREALTRGLSKTFVLDGVRAFVESFVPPSILLVVGAGHVAMPLTELARIVGFQTVVVDGRPRFATRERFPRADRLHVGIPSELIRSVPLAPTTALVLVAHDYKYDLPVLRHALGTAVGYIGMLGSRRRGQTILALLREDGFSDEALSRIHVPIGLDLGARTAAEIALAILAEIMATRTGASGCSISEKLRGGGP